MKLCLRLVLSGLIGLGLMSIPQPVLAAACTDDAPYGNALSDLGTLPDIGPHVLWTRMQSAGPSSNRFQLEVNNEECFTIGGDSVSSIDWEWVNYQNGNKANIVSYDFGQTSGNKIRLLGIEPAVKIDSVLIVKDGCVPLELGDNCRSSGAVQLSGSNISTTGFDEPVSGVVLLSALVPGSSSNVSKVEYYVDGNKIEENTTGAGLDTTLVANGAHNVTTKVTYTNGTVENSRVSLTVGNKESAFSPFNRWVRLNKSPLQLVSSLLGIISVLGLAYALMRRRHLKNHHARTHGLH